MNTTRVHSRCGNVVLGFFWIGLVIFTPTLARAQLAQRNTDALRPPDVTAGAELFGGLEAEQDEEGTTFAPESPGDEDLGEQVILQETKQYEPFTVSLQVLGNYTSNAGLTDGDELEDYYVYSELDLRYIPRITDKLFGNFSANYGIYRYNDHSAFDFDSLEATAGLMVILSELDNLVAWTNYSYTRLTEGHDGHTELLTDHSIEVGLYYPVPIGDRQFAFGSYLSAFSVDGDPGLARRNEHGLTLGYAFLPGDKLELSAYYQIFIYDYLEHGRQDLLQDVGLGLTWKVTQNVEIGLQASYSFNDSNTSGGDYTVGEVGALLNIAVRF